MSVLNEEGQVRDDLILPSGELGREIQQNFEAGQDLLVFVMTAMDRETVISFKTVKNE